MREYFTRKRLVSVCKVSWRYVLVGAIVALTLAAFATGIGVDALSRFFGTIAWTLASIAVVAGLIGETAPEVPS